MPLNYACNIVASKMFYEIIIWIHAKSGGKQPIFHTPEYLKQYMSKEILQWESEIWHSSRPHISGGNTKIPIKKITIFIL
jgi:hypothetical protein